MRGLLGRQSRDWWPDALPLNILTQGGMTSDPMGEDFDYVEAFKSIRGAEKDLIDVDLIRSHKANKQLNIHKPKAPKFTIKATKSKTKAFIINFLSLFFNEVQIMSFIKLYKKWRAPS